MDLKEYEPFFYSTRDLWSMSSLQTIKSLIEKILSNEEAIKELKKDIEFLKNN